MQGNLKGRQATRRRAAEQGSYGLMRMGLLVALAFGAPVQAAPVLAWQTVVNNSNLVPTTGKKFNSYNQPSINDAGLVVFRARSAARGRPATGSSRATWRPPATRSFPSP